VKPVCKRKFCHAANSIKALKCGRVAKGGHCSPTVHAAIMADNKSINLYIQTQRPCVNAAIIIAAVAEVIVSTFIQIYILPLIHLRHTALYNVF